MVEKVIMLVTTNPNPRRIAAIGNPDAGVTGWKRHIASVDSVYKGLVRERSLCGILPRFGWGVDSYIDDICSRCKAIAEKKGIAVPKD